MDVGSYVAVYYEKTYYIGRLLQKPQPTVLTCKFLHKGCGNTYMWPHMDDIETISSKFVFAGPLTILGHGPFTFSEQEDLQKLYFEHKKTLKNYLKQ